MSTPAPGDRFIDNDSRRRRGILRQRRLTYVETVEHRGAEAYRLTVEERDSQEGEWSKTGRSVRVSPKRLCGPFYIPES